MERIDAFSTGSRDPQTGGGTHDRRSLNAEIVWLLDRSLTPPA